MTWYAAHLVSVVQFRDGVQDTYPVLENVVLIEAADDDSAQGQADEIGRTEYHGGAVNWDGREAQWRYAGVRKLIECSPGPDDTEDDPDFRPGHGTEVTYSQLEVADEAELAAFVRGDPVTLSYEE
jgi:hypothetical protein